LHHKEHGNNGSPPFYKKQDPFELYKSIFSNILSDFQNVSPSRTGKCSFSESEKVPNEDLKFSSFKCKDGINLYIEELIDIINMFS
jgi:hypothetical protein